MPTLVEVILRKKLMIILGYTALERVVSLRL